MILKQLFLLSLHILFNFLRKCSLQDFTCCPLSVDNVHLYSLTTHKDEKKCYAISTSNREFILISMFAYQQTTRKHLQSQIECRGSTTGFYKGSVITMYNYCRSWSYEIYCSHLRAMPLAGCNISHNADCLSNYLLTSCSLSLTTLQLVLECQRESVSGLVIMIMVNIESIHQYCKTLSIS